MRISDWSSDVCSSDLGLCGTVILRIDRQSEAFISAPAIANAEMLQTVDHRDPSRIAAAIQNEGEEAARPRKVPFPECVAGAAGKGRVQNPRHFRLLSQPLCYLKSACLMLGQSELQGAQPSAGEIAIIGAGRLTEGVRRLAQRWPQSWSCCYGAQHQVTVPGYIFGAGKNGQIDAMADGPEIERRRPGIDQQI